jgi:hypothetical protein
VLAGLTFLLVACASSPSYRTEAACDQAPVKQGETGFCDYYSGFGWGHVPYPTTIRTD